MPRAIDIGEVCEHCHARVRQDADGCLGCACEYRDEDVEDDDELDAQGSETTRR
jgi:hypothetical protein